MARLTVKAIEAAKPKEKPYKLTVDTGLYIRISTNGDKRWIVKYVINKQQKEVRLPAAYGNGDGFMSLAQAVAENARIQALARDGIDFTVKREEVRLQAEMRKHEEEQKNLTVHDLYIAWINDGVARVDDNAELKRLFQKDILPTIGQKLLRKLSDSDILVMLRKMIQRGVTRLAIVAYNDTNQMLTWGEKRQPWRALLTNGNPCDLVKITNLLPDNYEEERDRILSNSEIRQLKEIFQLTDKEWQNASNRRSAAHPFPLKYQIALWISLGTLCRIGELLIARWEHVNLETRVWYIPRENVKGGRGKKQEHYIFLSDFVYRQFAILKEITGETSWLFPAKNKNGEETHVCPKTISKAVGDRQERFKNRKPLKNRRHDNTLILGDGLHGAWTPHDLRHTGATMMQILGISMDIIDRCQNHILPGSKVRRHYLHHDYAEEKKKAWAILGERLEEILSN